MRTDKRGFTLIELMIVVAIIGILAAAAIPAFLDYMKKSKATEAANQLDALGKAAKRYYGENSGFIVQTSALLPSTASATTGCCGGKGGVEGNAGTTVNNKCTSEPTKFKNDKAFGPMGFSVGEENAYGYSYTAAANTAFTATAYGDTDCDGTPGVYTLSGTLDAAGNASTLMQKPTGTAM